jgi:tocopherol O-methyltransferase
VITPDRPIAPAEIAAHYDELDLFYRELWGEHVHHGLWEQGDETPQAATLALVDRVAELAQVQSGDIVCDIGCGYGATARRLASHYGAVVTALTITPAQHRFALSVGAGGDNPRYLLRDWQENGLNAETFDAAIAIESMSHMSDKRRALAEAKRVLKPGGRLVLCVWLAAEHPRRWATRHLLEPICREGRLPGLASEVDYRRLLQETGFELTLFEDVSRYVRRTWAICIARALKAVCFDPKYRRFLLDSNQRNRQFFITMFRILLAYHLGAMRYGIFAARKPGATSGAF